MILIKQVQRVFSRGRTAFNPCHCRRVLSALILNCDAFSILLAYLYELRKIIFKSRTGFKNVLNYVAHIKICDKICYGILQYLPYDIIQQLFIVKSLYRSLYKDLVINNFLLSSWRYCEVQFLFFLKFCTSKRKTETF